MDDDENEEEKFEKSANDICIDQFNPSSDEIP